MTLVVRRALPIPAVVELSKQRVDLAHTIERVGLHEDGGPACADRFPCRILAAPPRSGKSARSLRAELFTILKSDTRGAWSHARWTGQMWRVPSVCDSSNPVPRAFVCQEVLCRLDADDENSPFGAHGQLGKDKGADVTSTQRRRHIKPPAPMSVQEFRRRRRPGSGSPSS